MAISLSVDYFRLRVHSTGEPCVSTYSILPSGMMSRSTCSAAWWHRPTSDVWPLVELQGTFLFVKDINLADNTFNTRSVVMFIMSFLFIQHW